MTSGMLFCTVMAAAILAAIWAMPVSWPPKMCIRDRAKPAAAKGQYIKSCVVASTMGPGVKVNGAKMV